MQPKDIEEALRSRDAFLRLATHELRGMLSAIQLHADTLTLVVRQGAPQKDVEARAEKVTRQVQRMARSLEEVMDLARASSGRLTIMQGDTDLVAVARGEVARAAEALARAGSHVELTAPERVVGRWDQGRIEHAVEALLARAVRAGGERIRMVVTSDGGVARLELTHEDNAAPVVDAAAFDSFEAAMAATGPAAPALALWLARLVADAHGGTLELAPGRSALVMPQDGKKVAPSGAA
ncbi:MAG TPA: histidine kinase dimerization/phospho-acceptor domain-containing protein [Kofleriaceae bacterium]|nr:histidine kinase dimerization/phospho-acceptor domain-containing protein [Kofleriaceae bacterium]